VARPGRRARATRGFSLIELLTVMAILAVLSGLLFPVIAKSREQARKTVCMSNLRQIGMALSMYASNHAGLIPPTGDAPWRAIEHIWNGTLNPPRYIGLGYLHEKFGYGVAPQMYYCPAAEGRNRMDWPDHSWSCWEKVGPDWPQATCGCSYVYRETGFGGDKILARNAETPAMVMDFQIELNISHPRYNHFLQGVNILFYDGSVKWVPDPTAAAAGYGRADDAASYEAAFRWADKQY
jgi:prepilin-type N-terminal cleavage/methylation domain-containing protein/prepilin-type processing-associated H-X9-DG protein